MGSGHLAAECKSRRRNFLRRFQAKKRGPVKWSCESATPHLRGIPDASGRLMVIMSHNTDIADGWEREGEEWEFFYRFSSDAYALGINIVLYTMTH